MDTSTDNLAAFRELVPTINPSSLTPADRLALIDLLHSAMTAAGIR